MNGKSNNENNTEQLDHFQEEFTLRENKPKKFLVTYGLLIATIAAFVIFGLLQPAFLSERNILNVLSQASITGIFALGLTNILISGNFDISFAQNATLVAIICPLLVTNLETPLFVAYLIALIVGTIISTINGVIVVFLRVPSFIGTLGMSGVIKGICYFITGGSVINFPYLPDSYKILGKGRLWGTVPVIVVTFIIIALINVIFLEKSFKGRQFFAVGFNQEAAKRVGINIKQIQFQAFVIMGIIAGIGGLAIGSLFEVGNPIIGDAYLFPAIIVALLGAVFLKEGVPNALGTFLAAIFMAVLANGFIFLGFNLPTRDVLQGIILIIAISFVSVLKPGGIPPVKM